MSDPDHYGEMTVRQLVELVQDSSEFPSGLDTRIGVGDVEGNNGTSFYVTVTAHAPGDIVLAVDTNSGDMDYP